MIIEKSNIKYTHFGIADLSYKCTLPQGNKLPLNDLDVDVNYDVLKISTEKNIFQLILDIKLYPPEDLPGYHITLKSYGVFELFDTDVKADIDQALVFTCLPLLIGSVRGFLSEITAQFPYGKYLLPLLPVKSLAAATENKEENVDIKE